MLYSLTFHYTKKIKSSLSLILLDFFIIEVYLTAMARVTVEDCIAKVDSPYELVLVAKERATQLNSG